MNKKELLKAFFIERQEATERLLDALNIPYKDDTYMCPSCFHREGDIKHLDCDYCGFTLEELL